jgi:hypothetical protein
MGKKYINIKFQLKMKNNLLIFEIFEMEKLEIIYQNVPIL